ncbi:MAG: DUF1847 domain-containing protein [Chloroflexia bacterium]
MVELNCAGCGIHACRLEPGAKPYPASCPIVLQEEALTSARERYTMPTERALALAAACTEAAGYCRETRVEEVMSFARRLGARRLGLAFCIGLFREAAVVREVLEAHGFEVRSVCCKVGSIPKEEIGLTDGEKVRPGEYEPLCNPIGQAMLLNEAGTQLNVVVGLCVGHDSLFFRHSQAPVTVLVAKDRVLGHNPVAALYSSYYRRLREPREIREKGAPEVR